MSRDQGASLLCGEDLREDGNPLALKELSVLNKFVTSGIKITDGGL